MGYAYKSMYVAEQAAMQIEFAYSSVRMKYRTPFKCSSRRSRKTELDLPEYGRKTSLKMDFGRVHEVIPLSHHTETI